MRCRSDLSAPVEGLFANRLGLVAGGGAAVVTAGNHAAIIGPLVADVAALGVSGRRNAAVAGSRRLAGPSAAVAAFAADGRHVGPIAADRLPALPAGDTGFIRCEFVSSSLGMGGAAALAGNLTLFARVHRGKTALACVRHWGDLLRVRCGY